MKAIMISIRPEFVQKILNGEKTIEIRKTKPSCKLPCKVYIYCTYSKRPMKDLCCYSNNSRNYKLMDKEEYDKDFAFSVNGSVVAEFTLNKITKHDKNFIGCEDNICYNFKVCDVKNAGFETDCLSLIDFDNFVEDYGKGKTLYAWRIDNLKIYDKPKELSEFSTTLHRMKGKQTRYTSHLIQRPPQSWCYVEDLGGAEDE